MRLSTYRFKAYFSYLKNAKYKNGFSVHSPFAFQLITEVFEEKTPYYIYKVLEDRRHTLENDDTTIHVTDYGTRPSGNRKVSDIAHRSVKSKRYAQLIFRIVNHFQPLTAIELGTSLGITTAYIAKAMPNGTLHTFEGCDNLIKFANETARRTQLKNIQFHQGDIDKTLEKTLKSLNRIDFAFLDANHTKEATLRYYELLAEKAAANSVFILDDIHLTKDMEEAWTQIRNDRRVTVTFDFFTLGVIFFNDELQKQDYIYKF